MAYRPTSNRNDIELLPVLTLTLGQLSQGRD